MNGMRWSVVTGIFSVWASTCMASSPGVIHFQGSIVGVGCATVEQGGTIMELKGCPLATRGSQYQARPVSSTKASGNTTTNVKLVASSVDGRFYDQQYVLVDGLGKLIQSGNYVITVTSP